MCFIDNKTFQASQFARHLETCGGNGNAVDAKVESNAFRNKSVYQCKENVKRHPPVTSGKSACWPQFFRALEYNTTNTVVCGGQRYSMRDREAQYNLTAVQKLESTAWVKHGCKHCLRLFTRCCAIKNTRTQSEFPESKHLDQASVKHWEINESILSSTIKITVQLYLIV